MSILIVEPGGNALLTVKHSPGFSCGALDVDGCLLSLCGDVAACRRDQRAVRVAVRVAQVEPSKVYDGRGNHLLSQAKSFAYLLNH